MRDRVLRSVLLTIGLALLAVPLLAQGGDVTTRLRAFDEVPALSTPGGAHFEATLNEAGTELTYTMSYFNVEGSVTQSHIHLGQKGVNGGIMVFLCSNLGNGPAGTQSCPAHSGTISGTLHAADIIGPTSQGISAGEFFSFTRALRAEVAYVNIHTDLFPGGEIRGQVRFAPND
jgi:hypothetical protein